MQLQPRRLAVIGLGFIGLPLALSYAMKGCEVTGIDVDEELVRDINRGLTPLQESYRGSTIGDILRRELDSGRFTATTEYSRAPGDSYVITVGIPIEDGESDMSHLESACRSLGSILKDGDLVLVRSTVIPGTTEETVKPLLETASGLAAGSDFHLAYSSERIAEGRAFEEFVSMPLAVGGVNEASISRAVDLLQVVTEAPIHRSDIRVVETAKILENLQRDINIALTQEFARFAEAFDIDTYEMIRIANTHRRVNLLTPGPGVGGYCLPNALYYLLPRARELGVDLPLSLKARSINDGVPAHLVDVLEDLLRSRGREIQGAAVGVLGYAMKDYSSDVRHSPALELIAELEGRGAEIRAYDPVVPDATPYRVDSLQECITGADAVILAARQEAFDRLDWTEVCAAMAPHPILIDTRDAIPREPTGGAALWRI